MTLTIHLSAAAERQLLERAAHNGQTLEGYVQALLEREAQGPAVGQGSDGSRLTPELREWLCQQINEEETVADLQHLREKGGPELQEFLPDLEQVVQDSERANR
jgi:hypothetical protein